jgi:hypothetical protein
MSSGFRRTSAPSGTTSFRRRPICRAISRRYSKLCDGQTLDVRLPTATRPLGAPSPRTGKPMPQDIRPGILTFFKEMEDTLKAIFTDRDYEALRVRIMEEIPADTPPMEAFVKALQIQKEAAIASSAGWPEITLEQLARAGTDWHIFPNLIFLMWPDGALAYRARPDAEDPNFCFFDVWSLARYAPGKEPPLKREYFYGPDDWKTEVVQRFGLVLSQDFQEHGRGTERHEVAGLSRLTHEPAAGNDRVELPPRVVPVYLAGTLREGRGWTR